MLKFCLTQKSSFGQGGFLSREDFLPSVIRTPTLCVDDNSSNGRKMPGVVRGVS